MERSIAQVQEELQSGIETYGRASSRYYDDSDDISFTIKSNYTKTDYDHHRPGDRVPTCKYESMKMCGKAYNKVGIVFKIINLMGDFASAGVQLNHPTPSVQKMYRKWFNHIKGPAVSERFANYLLKLGNVVGIRKYSAVPMKSYESGQKVLRDKRVVSSYDFVCPMSVEIAGGSMSSFINNPILLLKIQGYVAELYADLSKAYGPNKDALVKEMLSQFPPEIRNALLENKKYVILPQKDTFKFHYRKDDWDALAYSVIHPVLENILLLEKMHLTDFSALDGAVSSVRLWRLGYIDTTNPANSIIPKPEAYKRLKTILAAGIAAGSQDIVWGPDIDFKESDTKVHQFLGSDKYSQCMLEIYEGLGVPAALTGSGGSSNFNNNYVSMQTMIKSLQYIRNALIDFWTQEISIFAEEVGVTPATLSFENINLSDPSSTHNLVLALIDRDLISAEAALPLFNFLPEIEVKRIIREQKQRLAGKLPPKAGPYHNSEKEHDLLKLFVQKGVITPGELGIELEEKKNGELMPLEIEAKTGKDVSSFSPEGIKGRPVNSRDKAKRKTPDTTNPSFATYLSWGINAQNQINDILLPRVLKTYKLDNARQMSTSQKKDFESLKSNIFSNLEPMLVFDESQVYNFLTQPANENYSLFFDEALTVFAEENKRHPTTEELKHLNAVAHIFGNCNVV